VNKRSDYEKDIKKDLDRTFPETFLAKQD